MNDFRFLCKRNTALHKFSRHFFPVCYTLGITGLGLYFASQTTLYMQTMIAFFYLVFLVAVVTNWKRFCNLFTTPMSSDTDSNSKS